MKNCIYILIFASLPVAALFAEKNIARDPFWPIGYKPPPPPVIEQPAALPTPEIKEPEKPKPVTSDDWKMARKLLKINGYAAGVIEDAGIRKKISRVIINLKHYNSGEKIKLTHDKIDFVWIVGPIGNNSVELIQESANRIKPLTEAPEKGKIIQKTFK